MNIEMKLTLAVVLLLWNGLAFLIMGWDKRRAKRHEYRVPERILFFFAFFLAGPGILLGMSVFRHKTKHLSFQLGVPMGIITDCVLIWLVFSRIMV